VSRRLRRWGLVLAAINTLVVIAAMVAIATWNLDPLWVVGAPLLSGAISLSLAIAPSGPTYSAPISPRSPKPSGTVESDPPGPMPAA